METNNKKASYKVGENICKIQDKGLECEILESSWNSTVKRWTLQLKKGETTARHFKKSIQMADKHVKKNAQN